MGNNKYIVLFGGDEKFRMRQRWWLHHTVYRINTALLPTFQCKS